MTLQNPVNQTESHGFLGGHEIVALAGGGHFLHGLSGILGQDPVHTGFDDFQALQMNCHICNLALGTGRWRG